MVVVVVAAAVVVVVVAVVGYGCGLDAAACSAAGLAVVELRTGWAGPLAADLLNDAEVLPESTPLGSAGDDASEMLVAVVGLREWFAADTGCRPAVTDIEAGLAYAVAPCCVGRFH